MPDTGGLSHTLTQRDQKPVLCKLLGLDGNGARGPSLGGVGTGGVMEVKFSLIYFMNLFIHFFKNLFINSTLIN